MAGRAILGQITVLVGLDSSVAFEILSCGCVCGWENGSRGGVTNVLTPSMLSRNTLYA